MEALFDPARHEPLGGAAWDEARAREAIAAIGRDAEAAFDPERLWRVHPDDEDPDTPPDAILRGLYLGAAGMLHGLARLAEAGLHAPRLDPARRRPPGCVGAPPDEVGEDGSLLVGTSGVLLVAHRLAPSAATADALAGVIAANAEHPSNELLVGASGTMLAARAMHARTGEERFGRCGARARTRCSPAGSPDGLWTQDFAGRTHRYVGAGHGFAGNVLALARATRPRVAAIVTAHWRSWTAIGRAGRSSRAARRPPRRACSGATARPGSSPRSATSRATTPSSARCSPPAVSSSGRPARWPTAPGSAMALPATASPSSAAGAHGRRALAGPRARVRHARARTGRPLPRAPRARPVRAVHRRHRRGPAGRRLPGRRRAVPRARRPVSVSSSPRGPARRAGPAAAAPRPRGRPSR